MLSPERSEFAAEMNLKWPDKFTEADLEYWVKRLSDYPFSDVMESLSAFKAESRFAPKISEIQERLQAKGVKRNQLPSKWKTIVAETMARENPWMHDKPESEVVLHYHRFWFFKYRKGCQDDTGAIREVVQARLDEQRRIMLDKCANDLATLMGLEEAKRLAEWFDARQEQYREVIEQIRMGLESVEADAIPDFT